LQAVALGAAVQAGILEGQVSDVMVLDVWQANLMRAFARQRLQQDEKLAADAGLDPDQLESMSDNEVTS
jgi:molecular chaperone DnaK (HSP70)